MEHIFINLIFVSIYSQKKLKTKSNLIFYLNSFETYYNFLLKYNIFFVFELTLFNIFLFVVVYFFFKSLLLLFLFIVSFSL